MPLSSSCLSIITIFKKVGTFHKWNDLVTEQGMQDWNDIGPTEQFVFNIM